MYKIRYTSRALKILEKLPRESAVLIREKIKQVAKDPFAPNPNAAKLQGISAYRLRVGDWRVIYEINTGEIVVIVLNIGKRSEVYQWKSR